MAKLICRGFLLASAAGVRGGENMCTALVGSCNDIDVYSLLDDQGIERDLSAAPVNY